MPTDEKFLTSYAAHHWAASKGGLDLFRRTARAQSDAEVRATLGRLADDVAEDRARLRRIADAVGVGGARVAQWALSVGETVSRVKLNGRLVKRSPLSDVLEIEALMSAVHGKRAGWEGMCVLARTDARFDADALDGLLVRADDQLRELSRVHEIAARGLQQAGS